MIAALNPIYKQLEETCDAVLISVEQAPRKPIGSFPSQRADGTVRSSK